MSLSVAFQRSNDQAQTPVTFNKVSTKNLFPCVSCRSLKRKCVGKAPNPCVYCVQKRHSCVYSKSAKGGVENILHFDPRKLGVSHQTSTRASGVNRACDTSSSPTSPEFASSEGATSQAFLFETIVAADSQLPCVISEASTEGSIASQVPTSQLKEHLSPSVQLSPHHFTPEVMQILLQIPAFRNGVVNIFRYVASQVQASAWVNSSIRMSSFVSEFGPEDLSTQLAAFIMLTPGTLYEQTDMTCRYSNLAL